MNASIREAAAQWLIEFRTDTPGVAARGRFAAWLRASPEHIRAYLNVLVLWEETSGCDQQRRLDIDALVDLARTDRIVTDIRKAGRLDSAANSPESGIPDAHATPSAKIAPRRLFSPRTGIAVLLSLAINIGLWSIPIDSGNSDYATQIAEQRSVVLADGSEVDLDALSDLRVRFTPHERTVELVSGQALFRVAKDTARPFVVHAGGARLRAVGTRFNVNQTLWGTVLTVLEGRVTVLVTSPRGPETGSAGAGAMVEPGQQMTISHGTATAPQAIDPSAVTGWTRKLLVVPRPHFPWWRKH